MATGAGLTGTGSGAGTACTIWSGGVDGAAAGSGWTIAVAVVGLEVTGAGVAGAVTGAAGNGWIIGCAVFDAMATGARVSDAVGNALVKPGCGCGWTCV
ncbi:MAG: hypothetical protein ACTMKV_03255, partial [Sphingomonas parapaucimobilis]